MTIAPVAALTKPAKTLTKLAFGPSPCRGHIADRFSDGAIAATIAVLYTIY